MAARDFFSKLSPDAFRWLRCLKRRVTRSASEYPRTLGYEYAAVRNVLSAPGWNMSYGKGLVHETLENEFAEYIGSKHAIAVNSGGMAIQMSLRALGVKPGDEVIHQVDTCVANAFAVIAAGGTPIFADIDASSLIVTPDAMAQEVTERTKVIMPVHVWGQPTDMAKLTEFARQKNVYCVEDACLALGAEQNGRKVGSLGDSAVFSFGCMKPIQAGEGGMITTNNDSLAKELRTLRHWGEMSFEYGRRDHECLAWNGRMSEILAAVVLEQLRGYPKHLERLREQVARFATMIDEIAGIEILKTIGDVKPAYSQIVVQINPTVLGTTKTQFMKHLQDSGVSVWHSAFEPIPSVSFFRQGAWKEWILRGDIERVEQNYNKRFPNAELAFESVGLSFAKQHFMTARGVNKLVASIKSALTRKTAPLGGTS